MSSLSRDQINELITNAESEDEEDDVWSWDGDTSDSELEDDSLVKTIREKLVSKLCSTPVNTSMNLSSQFPTSNISNDDQDMYCFASSPEISINSDIDFIDIENLPIFIDNDVNISNISNGLMDVDESIKNTRNNISDNISGANKRSKKGKNQNSPKQVFSGQWNFNEDACSKFIPKKFNFNDSQSGVNLDFIDDLPPEFSELDIFKMIFDEHLVQHIVEETNKFFHFIMKNKVLKQHSKLKKWKETSVNEMYTFFALTLLMAHQKKNNIKDYWSTSPLLLSPIFGKMMSQDRYLIILRLLHFCDNQNQVQGNRLFKIDTIIESLRIKFRSVFKPYQKVCVDESIVEWKGRLKFKQYIPSKRHRFGIKLFVLCDCKTGYVLDYLVYTGDNKHIHFNESLQQSGSVISTLMEPYLNKSHIIYMDNWYSSPLLYQYLSEHNTGACGTVKNNRKGIPTFPTKLAPGQCISAITKGMMTCKWKDKRDVHMLSTVHNTKMTVTNKTDRVGNKIKKPDCILDYNVNMGLIDKSDMQMSFNNTSRRSIKWYKKFFFHLLDLSILNSGIVYNSLKETKLKLPEYRLKLIEQLLQTYSSGTVNISQSRPGRKIIGDYPTRLTERHFPSRIIPPEGKSRIQKKCHVHSQTKLDAQCRKDTAYECKECGKALCLEPCFQNYHTKQKY